MPKRLSAVTKLLRLRHIPLLGLTGTGLDDFDVRMIAAALEDAPPRVSIEQERQDLMQIDFVPVIRARLLAVRARVVEQPRRPGAAQALKTLHCAMQKQACSSRTPRPMNNETQRHAVISWCAATGAKHVFLAGTEQAK